MVVVVVVVVVVGQEWCMWYGGLVWVRWWDESYAQIVWVRMTRTEFTHCLLMARK